MKSRSLYKVLQYLDLSMHRIVDLLAKGDVGEVHARLNMLESVCERTLRQIKDVRASANVRDACSMEADFYDWLKQVPTADHDG